MAHSVVFVIKVIVFVIKTVKSLHITPPSFLQFFLSHLKFGSYDLALGLLLYELSVQ